MTENSCSINLHPSQSQLATKLSLHQTKLVHPKIRLTTPLTLTSLYDKSSIDIDKTNNTEMSVVKFNTDTST